MAVSRNPGLDGRLASVVGLSRTTPGDADVIARGTLVGDAWSVERNQWTDLPLVTCAVPSVKGTMVARDYTKVPAPRSATVVFQRHVEERLGWASLVVCPNMDSMAGNPG